MCPPQCIISGLVLLFLEVLMLAQVVAVAGQVSLRSGRV